MPHQEDTDSKYIDHEEKYVEKKSSDLDALICKLWEDLWADDGCTMNRVHACVNFSTGGSHVTLEYVDQVITGAFPE